jgi:hypothetical protein
MTYDTSLSGYNDEEAWPSLFDEFVNELKEGS